MELRTVVWSGVSKRQRHFTVKCFMDPLYLQHEVEKIPKILTH